MEAGRNLAINSELSICISIPILVYSGLVLSFLRCKQENRSFTNNDICRYKQNRLVCSNDDIIALGLEVASGKYGTEYVKVMYFNFSNKYR